MTVVGEDLRDGILFVHEALKRTASMNTSLLSWEFRHY